MIANPLDRSSIEYVQQIQRVGFDVMYEMQEKLDSALIKYKNFLYAGLKNELIVWKLLFFF